MKNLFIPLIDELNINSEMVKVASLIAALPKNHISYQPWSNYKTNCHASFAIAHNGTAIFLKYDVAEDVIKVNTHKTNGPVNKDNCVEFFVSFGSENEYYNIELNCVGISRIAYGKERSNRIFLAEETINKVKTHIEIVTAPIKSVAKYLWQITIIIPIEVFEYSSLKTLHQQSGFGNFFKCGDDLPHKNFYSWNMIDAKTPDFHLPEFFGSIDFG
ncbi:MAG: carbohydrate-binding family 9-like protein [Pelobium sp.]